jgi:hypothetical protein
MMNSLEEYLEHVWDGILSEDETLILQTYQSLSAEDQNVVLNHLKKMVSESGWQLIQVRTATSALTALTGKDPN